MRTHLAAPVLAAVLIAACGGSTTMVHDDAGAAPVVDARAVVEADLVSDGASGACALTPADVACNARSDCTVLLRLDCSCYVPALGVNLSSAAVCLPPPCPPPPGDAGCEGTGYVAQDGAMVGSRNLVGVGCIDHQCRTFVIIAG
jgi:hypothetical protein